MHYNKIMHQWRWDHMGCWAGNSSSAAFPTSALAAKINHEGHIWSRGVVYLQQEPTSSNTTPSGASLCMLCEVFPDECSIIKADHNAKSCREFRELKVDLVYCVQESDIVGRNMMHLWKKFEIQEYEQESKHSTNPCTHTHTTKCVCIHETCYSVNDLKLHEQVNDIWLSIVP